MPAHPGHHRSAPSGIGQPTVDMEASATFSAPTNVHEDKLWMHHKPKKHATVVLDFLKAIRRRYANAKRIYLVMDNLSTHKTPAILAWCRSNQVSPVFSAH